MLICALNPQTSTVRGPRLQASGFVGFQKKTSSLPVTESAVVHKVHEVAVNKHMVRYKFQVEWDSSHEIWVGNLNGVQQPRNSLRKIIRIILETGRPTPKHPINCQISISPRLNL